MRRTVSYVKITDPKEFLKHGHRYLKNSYSDAWIINLSQYHEELSEELINFILDVKKEKKILLQTNDLSAFEKITPYALYMTIHSDDNYDEKFIMDSIKVAQTNRAKILLSTFFKANTDNDKLFKLFDTILDENSSPIFLVDNWGQKWNGIVTKGKMLKNALYFKPIYMEMPLCVANEFNVKTATRAQIFSEFITEKGIDTNFIINNVKSHVKKAICTNCAYNEKCFGNNKRALFEADAFPEELNSNLGYVDLTTELQNNTGVSTGFTLFNPRNWRYEKAAEFSEIMQACRINKNFNGRNFFYTHFFSESVFFNRPLYDVTADKIWQEDPRGLMSLNWQFIASDVPELKFKQKVDCLLPQHGFVTTAKIMFTPEWTKEKQEDLNNFTMTQLKRIIVKYGGDPKKIRHVKNDLLYNGKKFGGKEWAFIPNVGYIENCLFTCDYPKEKKWLDQLYHHPAERPISGFTTEIPGLTKEIIIKELTDAAREFFDSF